jgi:hypothetical protein
MSGYKVLPSDEIVDEWGIDESVSFFGRLVKTAASSPAAGRAKKLLLKKAKPKFTPYLLRRGLDWEDVEAILAEVDTFNKLKRAIADPEGFCEQIAEAAAASNAKKLLIQSIKPELEPILEERGLAWGAVVSLLHEMGSLAELEDVLQDPESFCMKSFEILRVAKNGKALMGPRAQSQGTRGSNSSQVIPSDESKTGLSGAIAMDDGLAEAPGKILILDEHEIGYDGSGARFWKKPGCAAQLQLQQLGCCGSQRKTNKEVPRILTVNEAKSRGYRGAAFDPHDFHELTDHHALEVRVEYERIHWEIFSSEDSAGGIQDASFRRGKLRQKKIDELGRVFKEADVDGDNLLSKKELMDAIKKDDDGHRAQAPQDPRSRRHKGLLHWLKRCKLGEQDEDGNALSAFDLIQREAKLDPNKKWTWAEFRGFFKHEKYIKVRRATWGNTTSRICA